MAYIICPRCQTNNRQVARFCSKCGQALPVSSPGAGQKPTNFNPAPIPPPSYSNQQGGVICITCHRCNRASAKHCAYCGAVIPVHPIWIGKVNRARQYILTIVREAARRRVLVASIGGAVLVICIFIITFASLSGQNNHQAVSGNATRKAAPKYTDTPRPTPTYTLSGSLIETVQSLPSIAPTGGAIATMVQIAAPGGKVEIPELSDQDEIEIGREAAAEIEAEIPPSTDTELIKRVVDIGQKIVPFQPRQNIPFTFKVAETDDINAFALPGGYIYVTHGMLDYVQSDDELAGVIGHEIAHVALRHSAQQIQALAAADIAMSRLSTQDPNLGTIYKDQSAQLAAKMAAQVLLTGWGRDAELEADEYGTIYMDQAGFDPQAVLSLFRRFENQTSEPNDPLSQLMATHPPFPDRIARVEKTIKNHNL